MYPQDRICRSVGRGRAGPTDDFWCPQCAEADEEIDDYTSFMQKGGSSSSSKDTRQNDEGDKDEQIALAMQCDEFEGGESELSGEDAEVDPPEQPPLETEEPIPTTVINRWISMYHNSADTGSQHK